VNTDQTKCGFMRNDDAEITLDMLLTLHGLGLTKYLARVELPYITPDQIAVWWIILYEK